MGRWRSWAKCEGEYPGSNALHLAASGGDVIAGRAILPHGADLDAQDAEGKTALMNAILQHEDQTTRLLLEAGANPNIAPHKGWTPLTSPPNAASPRSPRS